MTKLSLVYTLASLWLLLTNDHNHSCRDQKSKIRLSGGLILCGGCLSSMGDIAFFSLWLTYSSLYLPFCYCCCLVVFFFYWIFSLFTFQMFSPFQGSSSETPYPISPSLSLWGCSSTHSPTPLFLPWHSPTLGLWTPSDPRASPPTDVQQGHHLLPHVRLEPWVPPWVFCGWCPVPGSSGSLDGWHLLLPWGCKSPHFFQSLL